MDKVCNSAGESEKEKTDNQAEQHVAVRNLRRPTSFSLRRRSKMYYFSDDSKRGVLKGVPIVDGKYKSNEIQTVLDKPDTGKALDEMWSHAARGITENSETNDIKSEANKDDTKNYAYYDQMRVAYLKSRREVTGPKNSDCTNDPSGSGTSRCSKSQNNDQDTVKDINQEQKEKSFCNPFKRINKLYQQGKALLEIDPEKSKESSSSEKHKKLSASKKSVSWKKSDLFKDNIDGLSETDENSPSDDFSKLSKTPITVL